MKVLIGRVIQHDPWSAEFIVALAGLAWCLYSIFLTSGLETLDAFKVLLAVVPPPMVYVIASVFPALQLYALRKNIRHLRWYLCAFMGFWWSFLALCVGQVANTPGVALYGAAAAANYLSVLLLWPPGRPRPAA